MLRSTVVGAQWPEGRLLAAGLSQDGLCKRCGDEPGTLMHRHVGCTKVLPEPPVPKGIQKVAERIGGPTGLPELLLSRGLLPYQSAKRPPADRSRRVEWKSHSGESYLGGQIYTDGSGTHPTDPELRRTGFSAVVLDPRSKSAVTLWALPA